MICCGKKKKKKTYYEDMTLTNPFSKKNPIYINESGSVDHVTVSTIRDLRSIILRQWPRQSIISFSNPPMAFRNNSPFQDSQVLTWSNYN